MTFELRMFEHHQFVELEGDLGNMEEQKRLEANDEPPENLMKKQFKTNKTWVSINHFVSIFFDDVVLNKLWLVLVDDKCPFKCL